MAGAWIRGPVSPTPPVDAAAPVLPGVARTRDEARAAYDRLAAHYDRLAGASEGPFREQGLRLLDVHPGEAVLELGCGTGMAAVALARAGAVVTAVDLSPRMLEIARARAGAVGLDISFVEGELLDIPVANGSQDAIFMSFVLDLIDTPDLARVLDGCRRALRPGGRLGLVVMDSSGGNRFAMSLYGWAHRVFPTWVDCRPLPVPTLLAAAGWRRTAEARGTMWGLGVWCGVAVPQGYLHGDEGGPAGGGPPPPP